MHSPYELGHLCGSDAALLGASVSGAQQAMRTNKGSRGMRCDLARSARYARLKERRKEFNAGLTAMKIISWFIVAIAFIGAQIFLPVSAASFDCKKAASEVEKLICQNPELSRLDDEMTRMYKRALASAPDKPLRASDGREWLKKEQRGWLRYTRNACTTVTCLKSAYEIQIITLTLAVQPDQKTRRHPDVWVRNCRPTQLGERKRRASSKSLGAGTGTVCL